MNKCDSESWNLMKNQDFRRWPQKWKSAPKKEGVLKIKENTKMKMNAHAKIIPIYRLIQIIDYLTIKERNCTPTTNRNNVSWIKNQNHFKIVANVFPRLYYRMYEHCFPLPRCTMRKWPASLARCTWDTKRLLSRNWKFFGQIILNFPINQ